MYLPLKTRKLAIINFKELSLAATEYSPLLDGHPPNGAPTTAGSKLKRFVSGAGEPSWADSLRFLVFDSWFNILLFFIPLSFVAHHLNWDAGLRFGFSFFAIIPLAKVGLYYNCNS